MTKKELNFLKEEYQKRFSFLQHIKICAEQNIKGWTKQDYENNKNHLLGYRICIINLIEVNSTLGTGDRVLTDWENEILQK